MVRSKQKKCFSQILPISTFKYRHCFIEKNYTFYPLKCKTVRLIITEIELFTVGYFFANFCKFCSIFFFHVDLGMKIMKAHFMGFKKLFLKLYDENY